jgi:hypothetical protein
MPYVKLFVFMADIVQIKKCSQFSGLAVSFKCNKSIAPKTTSVMSTVKRRIKSS